MILRIVLLLIAAGLIGYVVKHLWAMYRVNANDCPECDGQGFWRGTRGEKNDCRVCFGTGKKR